MLRVQKATCPSQCMIPLQNETVIPYGQVVHSIGFHLTGLVITIIKRWTAFTKEYQL